MLKYENFNSKNKYSYIKISENVMIVIIPNALRSGAWGSSPKKIKRLPKHNE